MKIVYVLSGTNMDGGATKSFLSMLRAVCCAGHGALVVCPDRHGIYEYLSSGHIAGAKAVDLNYTYDIYPFTYSAYDKVMFCPRLVKRIVKNRLAARQLSRIAKDFGAQLIHSNTSVNNVGYLAAKALRIPHIWHIREYGRQDFGMTVPFQYRKLRAPRNYTVAITSDINRSKGLSGNARSRVLYNPVVEEGSLRRGSADEGYFLYAGRLTERKGALDLVDAYIQAYANYGDALCPLYMAGRPDPHIEARIRSLSKEKGVDKKIVLLGEREDVAELMYKSRAVIVPSRSEGFGRVMPEAMAQGAIVVGRDTAGTKEQFDNGLRLEGTEIGFRYATSARLAEILGKLSLGAKGDYVEMINASQRVIGRLYGLSRYGDEVIRMYKEILKDCND